MSVDITQVAIVNTVQLLVCFDTDVLSVWLKHICTTMKQSCSSARTGNNHKQAGNNHKLAGNHHKQAGNNDTLVAVSV